MVKRYLETLRKDDALAKVLESVTPLEGEESVAAEAAVGRITSRQVLARFSNPPFTCSAMDGYAVDFEKTLSADLYNPLSLAKEKDVTRVNTGDPVPTTANAVIMVEDVEDKDQSISIRKPASLWQHVRMIGEDVVEGDALFPTNYRIRVFDVGLLIGAGIREVYVRKRPKLLIIPTGRELIDIVVEPVESMTRGRLIDFNSYTLKALAEELGFEACKAEIARNKNDLNNILDKSCEEYDVIIINAGSSAGTEDFTEGVINNLGTVLFHGVAMMPAKPTLFGLVRGKPVFGIPGYPVSTVIAFKTFIEPVYERLCGTASLKESITCVTPYKLASSIGVEEVLRVNLIEKHGLYYAYPLARGASLFSSMAQADGLIRIPQNLEGYPEGEHVSCELLRHQKELRGRIHILGSHDFSLDVMRDIIKKTRPDLDIISTHIGSLSGIIALQKGVVDLCTTHILDEKEKVYNIPVVKKYLGTRPALLINVAKRIQGLVVAKGNPRGVEGIPDLSRSDIRFVNRQVGSGTRILLDTMLGEQGIDRASVRGYDREEFTHAAVGVLVKDGIADVGLAIYPIARLFGLDFIPLVEEEYDLLVARGFAEEERFSVLMEAITSAEFARRLQEFGGYNTDQTGKTKYVNG
ncbi:MAG TPA: molybdopterin biosynthesis protein [Syntrophorhabdales bacterium]|nr:molybdopterin biosynthesis protein [Syntrophorhabdales bacterium]